MALGQRFIESEVKVLLETMLETVDFLHHHHIIRRDIKPANIIQMLNGRFILVDLGAAKLATGTTLGQTGRVIGSAEYVAPEQLRGKATKLRYEFPCCFNYSKDDRSTPVQRMNIAIH